MSTLSLTDPAALEEFCVKYADAVCSLDPDRVAELLTEDVVWHDVALLEPLRGREAVREFLSNIYQVVEDLSVAELDPPHRTVSADGTQVAWGWITRGTLRLPGAEPKYVDYPGVDLWTFRDGLISEYRGVYDLGQMDMKPS